MRKKLKGMTLVEVITAVSILFIVTGIAYAGICTGGNIITRAADKKKATMEEEEKISDNDPELNKENVTAVYSVHGAGNEEAFSVAAVKVSGDNYIIYKPYESQTEVPEDEEQEVSDEETTTSVTTVSEQP